MTRARAQEAALNEAARLAVGFQFTQGQGPVTLKAEVYRNLMLVEGRIQGSDPLRFILDTGAATSILDQRRARDLGLRSLDRTAISGVGGILEAVKAGGTLVRFPGVDLLNAQFVVISLDQLSAHLGRRIDGLLGEDLFTKLAVRMDYAHQTVELSAPWLLAEKPQGVAVPVEIRRTPFVRLSVGTRQGPPAEGTFQIDTGFNGSLHIYRSFVDLHRILEGVPKLVRDRSVGATGVLEITRGRVESLNLGPFKLPSIVGSFYPPSYSSTGAGGHDGNLGGEILRRFTVTFDYARRRMILEPGPSLTVAEEADMSGLSLVAEGEKFDRVRVDAVAPNTPGARAGVREGDWLESVDETPAGALGLEVLARRFRQPGTRCTVGLRRDGRIKRVTLRFARLV